MYLSGPMTGVEEYNYPAFREAARALRAAGHRVLSPHEETVVNGRPWTYYMRRGLLSMIERCDSIAMLPGWADSAGACLELAVAEALGFAVYDIVNGTLVLRG